MNDLTFEQLRQEILNKRKELKELTKRFGTLSPEEHESFLALNQEIESLKAEISSKRKATGGIK